MVQFLKVFFIVAHVVHTIRDKDLKELVDEALYISMV